MKTCRTCTFVRQIASPPHKPYCDLARTRWGRCDDDDEVDHTVDLDHSCADWVSAVASFPKKTGQR
jgi:hypothetical protein